MFYSVYHETEVLVTNIHTRFACWNCTIINMIVVDDNVSAHNLGVFKNQKCISALKAKSLLNKKYKCIMDNKCHG